MSDDVLGSYSVQEVAAWYRRLGIAAAARGKADKLETSLSADFLLRYLNVGNSNRNPYFFNAPRHLRRSRYVLETLMYHRSVFLSQEKARLGGEKKTRQLAGVIPRLQDGRWNGKSQISMYYESLVEVPISVQAQAYMGMATPEDFDLLTSLRGFQLRSEVTIRGTRQPSSNRIKVSFVSYLAKVKDKYDWNYNEYFTVPNPDYGKTGEGMIAVKQEKVRVYHKNAKRLEDAGLAKPFHLESQRWNVTSVPGTNQVTQDAEVERPQRQGVGGGGGGWW